MKRSVVVLSTLLLGVLLLPAPGGSQLRLIPHVGLYAPVTDLGTVNTAEGIRDVGERESSLAYGVSLELGEGGFWAIRATGLYGSDAEVPVEGVGCNEETCSLRSTVLGLAGSLVLRPLPSTLLIRPYVLAGAGMKRYDFDFRFASPLEDLLNQERQVTGLLGLGLEWDVGLLAGTVELSDYVSGDVLKDGETQHDFFLTMGIIL